MFEKVCNCYEKEKAILYRKRNNTAKKMWALRAQVKSLKEESQKNREEIREELKNEFLEKISDGIGQVFKMGVDCGSDEKSVKTIKELNETYDIGRRDGEQRVLNSLQYLIESFTKKEGE
jgi:predicted RNA-binding protein Jag